MTVVELHHSPKELFDMAEKVDNTYRYEKHVDEGTIAQLVRCCQRLHPAMQQQVPCIPEILAHAKAFAPAQRYPECLRWSTQLKQQLIEEFMSEEFSSLYELIVRGHHRRAQNSLALDLQEHVDAVIAEWQALGAEQKAQMMPVEHLLSEEIDYDAVLYLQAYKEWKESLRQHILSLHLR